MGLPLPPSFVDLRTAYARKGPDCPATNIMGVVVDHLNATKSGGSDYVITFTLYDPSWIGGIGLKCRCFHKVEARLPPIMTNGDVVLLRSLKIKALGKSTEFCGISNSATTWAVLPEAYLPAKIEDLAAEELSGAKLSPGISLSRIEIAYAIFLHNTQDRTSFAPPAPAPATSLEVGSMIRKAGGVAPPLKDKFRLVRDLVLPSGPGLLFVEMLGEVRKCYKNDFRVELSITDYTSHKALFNYAYGCDEDGADGDQYGYMADMQQKQWPGPWGRMTIMVALWDAHAMFAREKVKEGDFVFLRNVQVGMDKEGKRMEGNVRGDRKFPDKVNVQKQKPRDAEGDPRMKDLLNRKRGYEERAKRENKQFFRDASNMPKKGTLFEAEQPGGAGKRRKKDRKRNQKAAQMVEEASMLDNAEVKVLDENVYVRCQKVDVPMKSIDEIMDREILKRKTPSGNDFYLPFQNCCYHSRLRVVDFFPDDIAHFSAPYRESDYQELSDYEESGGSDIDMTPNENLKWEWRFYLLVEDAGSPAVAGQRKPQMPLLVADQDGDFLLDMEASDLSKDPEKLAKVREKLFVLWGDLQERKEAAKSGDKAMNSKPSNKPFECLIKEYGIQARDKKGKAKSDLDFDRMFRMWGATVKGH